jgi:CRISPR-associated endonuclease/helicase Cas3
VRRHRHGPCEATNIHLFDRNLRSVEQPAKAAFCRPGFETDQLPFRLHSHHLSELLSENERSVVDARPRIVARPASEQRPSDNLVDLEHARLAECMLPPAARPAPTSERERRRQAADSAPLNASSIWTLPLAHLTGVLAQQLPFREDNLKRVALALLPDDEEEDYVLNRIDPGKKRWETLYVPEDASRNHRIADHLVAGNGIAPWGETDYMTALTALADSMQLSLSTCARRYGTVTLPDSTQGWRFHPALGFSRQR